MEKSKRFSEKLIHNLTVSNYQSNHRRNISKNLELTLLFMNFSKVFDFIHRGRMEQQILFAYKETVTAIMLLYKNMKAMVRSQ